MRAGFTLIETSIALVVTALAVLSLQFGFQMLNVHSQQRYDEQLAWYQMLAELEGKKYRFTLGKVYLQKAELVPNADDERIFYLKGHNGNLMLTTDKGGYMPLFKGMSYYEFDVDHGHLKINAKTKFQQFTATTSIGGKHD
ncbi:prepilin-type N-terminal cleavage/methylation domain-containing protein [Lactobacillus sp. LC28-10]|uniref:Prepilin-type N-terminal cleavage/methylation domain-containing protein n=1 Tax=Secundilactobacillus angelensis TaxID=2722706 RepID=A0ABX1KYI0_9LACO|nr:competence type IV pilus minor pilin ComGF [Secundilactobacillus angelensis]MCH5462605.1 prepilin-type N-terminal cleavage/methylation domain-containing protein [Secundilactobacillus angelensis]NLR18204.1 prepilin-type N-terminal cleavage/methylation domain-containing protein [Secundilactobacillus angelensis]